VVREGIAVKELIQVRWGMGGEGTRRREVEGLAEAMGRLGIRRGLVLTEEEASEEELDEGAVRFVPLWRWLLGEGG
jgi:predicted AAA+ superfamily ATPase